MSALREHCKDNFLNLFADTRCLGRYKSWTEFLDGKPWLSNPLYPGMLLHWQRTKRAWILTFCFTDSDVANLEVAVNQDDEEVEIAAWILNKLNFDKRISILQKFIDETASTKQSNKPMDNSSNPGWPASVAQFTKAAALAPLPSEPTPINKAKVTWLCSMVMSELYELACTVSPAEDNKTEKEVALELLQDAFNKIDKNGDPYSSEPIIQAAQQADAIVDLTYYSLNVAAAHCIDLEPVFALVHQANMAKVDAKTGIVRRSEDGKIQKPPGWTPPDIESELKRQLAECQERNSKRTKM
jgi:predicted HAD superfamily Cof-like phosphohydrolase